MAGRKLYITGGIGSRASRRLRPDYELNNHTAYCETCASIANVYWNHRMFLATGDSRYEDILERALYNGVISGVSLSGDRFFYDNPLEVWGQHGRQAWFGCACCPGNVTRFMASFLITCMPPKAKRTSSSTYIHKVRPVSLHSQNKIEIRQTTDYPWDGNIRLAVHPEKEADLCPAMPHPGMGTRPSGPDRPDHYTGKGKGLHHTSQRKGHWISMWKTVMPSSCGNGRKATRCNWISRWTYAGWKPVSKWRTTGEKPPSNGAPSSTA